MSGILQTLIASIGGAINDTYFNLVTLLLPGNGTNGAQNNTFLDSSTNNFTITRNGNTTQGTFSPFSQTGWSGNFNTSTTYLTVTDTANLRFGSSNFTIEAWVYRAASGAIQTIASKGASTPTGWVFQISAADKLVFTDTSTSITGATTLNANTWYYVAVVRAGTGTNQTTLYVNAASDATGTSSTNFNQTNNMLIGADRSTANFANGYISNLRLSNTNRTISSTPTSALTADANTIFLALNSNWFQYTDSTAAYTAMAVTGTPSVQAFSPFAPTAAYSAATVGGSGYFDGSGDYLTGNGVLVTTTTANTFSCEGWFYPTTFANLIWLVGDMDATGGTNNVAVDISTGGAVELYWWDGAGKRCTSTTTMRLNQWNYFAIVVNAGAISIYVNSTTAGQSGTTTLTNRSASSQTFSVGAYLNSTTPNGYIGSLRWSTSARTISSIPTAPYTSDANTRLLLNFTNAGITDATAKNDLETVGNAQISTAQSKFGGSSMYFDGTGDYLKGVYSPNMILSGDFTIECWINFSAHGNYAGIVSFANSNTANPPTSGWAFNFYSTTDRLYFETGTGFSLQATNAVTTNTWNHVAIVRSGSTITHYLNGTANGAGTSSATFTPLTTDNFVIGVERGLSGTITGYIDDLRISRYARYTGNFTPPTEAFPVQ